MERNNPAARFPSDFDVVQLSESLSKDSIEALHSHPAIKRVTPQHQVFRNLKYINETEHLLGENPLPRFSGRSSLSLVSIATIPII